jgi:hypothetical protein
MMKKAPNVEIEIEMGNSPVKGMGEQATEAEDEMFMEMAPKGKFTPKGLMALVKETNKMLPLFGQEGNYPALNQAMGQLPTDFVRILAMFSAAVDDAIASDVLSPDMALDFSGVKDDTGLMMLAGKLNSILKSMEFKRFLKEPQPQKEEEEMTYDEERTPMPEMGEDDAESLMMSRMS